MMKQSLTVMMSAVILMLSLVASRGVQAEDTWPLDPFWKEKIMHGERLFFIRQEAGQPPQATLLFTPLNVLSVVSPLTGHVYQAGVDYVVDASNKKIMLPEGSSILYKERAEMYPDPSASNAIAACTDGVHWLYFGEDMTLFQNRQVEITYTHPLNEWVELGWTPPVFEQMHLARTTSKLEAAQPLNVVLYGDSISYGASATALYDTPPRQPAFGQLVVDRLADHYGSAITFTNLAVGGTASAWGLANVQQVIDKAPDLVILGFGMNDASGRVDADVFQSNTQQMIDAIRASYPQCEFILIASMTGNPEWTGTSLPHHQAYLAKFNEMVGDGIALADMTTLWNAILARKTFADMTGNGVNHPNDFGHRLYAQALLAMLMPAEVSEVENACLFR